MESSELRGPLGRLGEGGSEVLGAKRNGSPPPTWPVGGSECTDLTPARSSCVGERLKKKQKTKNQSHGKGTALGGGVGAWVGLLIVFLEDWVLPISAKARLC